MSEKKRGRGRPKGSPNKPLMELITERVNLTKNADVYEILCQADLVAQEDEDKAAHVSECSMNQTLQYRKYYSGTLIQRSIVHYLMARHHSIRMMHQQVI